MTELYLKKLDEYICQWIRGLDDIIPGLVEKMETSTKKDRFDLVTNVDKQIQNHFQNFLQEHYPTHQLLAEEKDNSDITPYEGHLWIMDPIDGTSNLVKQQEDYCIIIGYFIDGEPKLSYIYDYPHQKLYRAIAGVGAYENNQLMTLPKRIVLRDAIISFKPQVLKEDTIQSLFQSAFDFRIIGSCGLDSIRVIKGQFGAHINTNPKPWDISAQFLFARELGLIMTKINGEPLDFSTAGPFIISNPGCYDDMIRILNEGESYSKSNHHIEHG